MAHRSRALYLESNGRSEVLTAHRILLATGAFERPVPIPGWTLPGVMAAGAAQILLKSADLVPEGRAVLAGQGPLLYLVAAQLAPPARRLLRCSRRRHGRIISRRRGSSTRSGRAAGSWRKDWV